MDRITLATVCTCIVPIPTIGHKETIIESGKDFEAGCTIMYQLTTDEGGYYKVYDRKGNCIEECVIDASTGIDGGGTIATPECARYVFCASAKLSKTVNVRVGDIVNDAESLEDLQQDLLAYGFDIDDISQISDLYLELKGDSAVFKHSELLGRTLPDQHPISSITGLKEALEQAGKSFVVDKTLSFENGVLSVNTADEPEKDNTLPITSAAVATTVGNIDILLQTI